MTRLDVTGLVKAYGARPVLRGLDLWVEGGITAILGPSGCGKTTLLRIVAGFIPPDGGTVRLGDRVVAGRGRPVPPRQRRVGYVPQEGALFPHLTVAANVAFGLRRADRAGSRVATVLELVELPPDLAGRYPHELSGGQQQRVALARALAPEPALVLLDEPFSNLDASLREDTGRAVARALRASGATAVLVTHDQGDALSLADQVAVMAEGRVVQVATPSSLYLRPVSAAVAAFVGHASLLPGRLTGRSATSALGTLRVSADLPDGPVELAVRPEQVTVEPILNDSAIPGGTEGKVLDVSFFGHDATVRVALADGTLVSARMPATGAVAAGQPVRLSVLGEVLAFPGGEAP